MVLDREGARIYREPLKTQGSRRVPEDQMPRIMRSFGVPERYLKCRLEEIPDHAEYRNALMSYVEALPEKEPQGLGLVLIGPFGSGKTGGSCALIYEVARRWGRCRFVSARDLGRIANDYAAEKQRLWKELRRYQFAVLDEVGCEVRNKTTREAEQIKQATEDLLRHRYDSQLTTIITTNMTVDKLFERYVCLTSIFAEAYEVVPVTGVDWRARR